ncbi:hypothetical protein AMS68_003608 [Peltaster fructicola]|uniref:J domain-containing protein n=1 Tax=Peltaster fructicola TaxID=286661 RepID=A0A6H0XTU1_9PEZI|nr:hypothetical protein AMS68_003608 [Peltaster fructicola]
MRRQILNRINNSTFYTLSKAYHPDLHPNDPNASKRFVQISEAYAVLSSADKRHIYDRNFARAHQGPSDKQAYPSGSFSSASSPAGGRPASGLSRRRTQFRGPPPSFYQSGGWGEQGAKRSEYASRPSHSWEGQAAEDGSGQGMPGTGPGGFAHGLENDVPHFNSRGHYETHSTIERTRHKARRKVVRNDETDAAAAGGTVFAFVMVSAVLGFGILITGAITGAARPSSKSLVVEDRV